MINSIGNQQKIRVLEEYFSFIFVFHFILIYILESKTSTEKKTFKFKEQFWNIIYVRNWEYNKKKKSKKSKTEDK